MQVHGNLRKDGGFAMNKRITSLAMALALTACSAGAGAQAELRNTAPIVDLSALKAQQAFILDEATGAWSLTPNAAQAALDALASGYGRGSAAGTLFFCVTLEGSAELNTLTPMLNMYFIGGAEVNAGAASLLLDGVRYDFELAGETSAVGAYRAEVMRAPLNADGIAMLRALAGADEFDVMLHGATKAYEFSVKLEADGDYANARAEMQAASVTCVRAALDILDALGGGAGDGGSISAWEEATGAKCAYAATTISAQPRVSLKLDEDFDLIKPGDSSNSVRELQKLLCEAGYMYVEPTTKYSSQTRAAVRRAQRELGFVPTGSADAALISALDGGTPDAPEAEPAAAAAGAVTAAGEVAAEAGVTYGVDGAARLRLDGYRFARSVQPSRGDESTALRAADADNLLIVFEGELTSLAAASADLTWDYGAALTFDGRYGYECSMAVEQDGGASFGSTVLPLGGGRLLVYAEVPSALAQQAGTWTLTLTLGETVLTYNTAD